MRHSESTWITDRADPMRHIRTSRFRPLFRFQGTQCLLGALLLVAGDKPGGFQSCGPNAANRWGEGTL